MFLLFYNLYVAMFVGSWTNFNWNNFVALNQTALNKIGEFITSIFGDNTYANLGDILSNNSAGFPSYLSLIATALATITSIGIVVMAVKGVKKAFSIFFMGLR